MVNALYLSVELREGSRGLYEVYSDSAIAVSCSCHSDDLRPWCSLYTGNVYK